MSMLGDMIPTEILELVLSNIDKTDKRNLMQMQLVCKRWNYLTQKHIYQAIPLDKPLYKSSKKSAMDIKRKDLLVRTVTGPNKSIGAMVESLGLDTFFGSKTAPLKCYVSVFARSCPNLLTLRSNETPPAIFYEILLRLRNEGCLQHLQFVTMPTETSEEEPVFNAYNAAMLAFKNSITSLQVACRPKGLVTVQNSFPLFFYLKDFVRLEDLHIVSNNCVLLYEFDELLDKCGPHLKSVEFDVDNHHMQAIWYNLNHDLSKVRSRRQVKKLTVMISRSLFSKETAFLILKFPALESLKFVHEQEPHEGPDAFIGSPDGIVLDFFQYLLKIKCLDLRNLITTASGLTKVLPMLAESMKIEKLVLTPLTPKGEEVTHVTLQHKPTTYTHETPKKAQKTKLGIKFGYFDVDNMIRQAVALFKDSVQDLLLGTEGEHYREDDGVNISLQLTILGRTIDLILDQMTALKTLRFSFLTIPLLPSQPTTRNQLHLDSLIIDYCEINQEVFNQISQRVKYAKGLVLCQLTWLNPVYSHFDTKISMPFTTFGTIRLYLNLNVESYLLIVWAKFSNKFFKISKPKEVKPLSSNEYVRLASLSSGVPAIPTITLHCETVSKIITVCGVIDF